MPIKTIKIPRLSNSDIKRFWLCVDTSTGHGPNKDCWEWTRGIGGGYGSFYIKKKSFTAHRISFIIFNGDIEENMYILHSCDNTSCVNPDHLFKGTMADNVSDMDKKGRRVVLCGEKNKKAKLKEQDVRAIRKEYATKNISQEKLGQKYKVHQRTINQIIRRETWRDIK